MYSCSVAVLKLQKNYVIVYYYLMYRSSFVFFVDWTVFIVGKLSPWINLDSDLPHIRANSEKVNNINV